jgi:hypothetical protein
MSDTSTICEATQMHDIAIAACFLLMIALPSLIAMREDESGGKQRK